MTETPPSPEGVIEWTSEDVAKYVSGLTEHFGQKACLYGAAMFKEDIDGKALLDLKSEELRELGFSLGHRKYFLTCIS